MTDLNCCFINFLVNKIYSIWTNRDTEHLDIWPELNNILSNKSHKPISQGQHASLPMWKSTQTRDVIYLYVDHIYKLDIFIYQFITAVHEWKLLTSAGNDMDVCVLYAVCCMCLKCVNECWDWVYLYMVGW